jgi:hypothetical protein
VQLRDQGLGWSFREDHHSIEISLKHRGGAMAVRPSLSVSWRSEIGAKEGIFVFSYSNPDPPK